MGKPPGISIEHVKDPEPDGDYPSDLPMFKGQKQVRTKISEVDGMEESHITYVPYKKNSKYFNYGKLYDQIDWTK